MNPWDDFMAECTLEMFPSLDLTHWRREDLADPRMVSFLMQLKHVHAHLHPMLYSTKMTPEGVYRHGIMTQLIDYNVRIEIDESLESLRTKLIEVKRQRRNQVTNQIREFIDGMDFA